MTVIDLANDSRTPPHDVDATRSIPTCVGLSHRRFLPACPPAHLRHAVGSG